MGPDLAPRRLNPFRASPFKSSFNPSCKQTRSRGGGIGYPLERLQGLTIDTRRVHNLGKGLASDDLACDLGSHRGQIGPRDP
jgi:hypothetical protein